MPTATLIAANTFNAGGNNCRDSSHCYEWAWWFTANTTSATATITVPLSSTPTAAVAEVIALANNNASTPVLQPSTNSGCNRFSCGNNTTTVTGAVASAPAAGDVTLQLLASDDQMGTSAPTWASDNSDVYFRNSTSQPGASLDVNLSSSGQQSETTSTSGWPTGNNLDWGTITFEVGHS
jgi:hypothetical protein